MCSQSLVYEHIPVLKAYVLQALACAPGRHYLDLTLGGAGHAVAILELTSPDGVVWASDRDADAVRHARQRLEPYVSRTKVFHQKMSEVKSLLDRADCPTFSGVLIDCGVSSYQLDTAERGFSFRSSGPLDMRMNRGDATTAHAFIHESREEDIANVLYQFGEERASRKIAKRIVQYRKRQQISTTQELADIVRSCFPASAKYRRSDPATKTFQAIRIFINSEFDELTVALDHLISGLAPGAKIAVITFHSLEDRIVKHRFRRAVSDGKGRLVYKKPIVATDEELEENPRSRSAKLRCLEIMGETA